MDYPGDASQDFNGLGPYDKAAVRFFYGETVDIEADTTSIKKKDYLSYLESSRSSTSPSTSSSTTRTGFGECDGATGRQPALAVHGPRSITFLADMLSGVTRS
jgi:hypothetical protein